MQPKGFAPYLCFWNALKKGNTLKNLLLIMATLLTSNMALACYDNTKTDAQNFISCYQAAESGDAVAQNNMGVFYYEGRGVSQNDSLAAGWFRLAADQGQEYSQYILGVFYGSGKGVIQNNDEAVKWLTAAVSQGHAGAQWSLAQHYRHGFGVIQNNIASLHLLSLSAAQGYELAQLDLGKIYYGSGLPVEKSLKDMPKAVAWLTLAAKQGNADAKALLNRQPSKQKIAP